MKKIIYLFFALFLMVFTSCDDEIITSNKEIMDVFVEGYVYDNETELPIDSVVVTGTFGEAITDEDGYYMTESMAMGSYRFNVEATGYRSYTQYVTIDEGEDDIMGNAYHELVETRMYKADQSFETQLLVSVGPTVEYYANMPYEITLNGSFTVATITGITSSTGLISLESLPDAYFYIKVDYTNVATGEDYYLYTGVSNPSSTSPTYSVSKTDTYTAALSLKSTNLVDVNGDEVDDFATDQNIELEFSDAVDQDKAEFDVYKYDNSYGWVEVLFTTSWSGNQVTLDPEGTNLEEMTTYRVILDVSASDDETRTLYKDIEFYTEGEFVPGVFNAITSVKLETSVVESSASAEYTMVVDGDFDVNTGDYIEVYANYAYDGKDEFLKIGSSTNWESQNDASVRVSIDLTDFPGIEIPDDGIFSDSREFQFKFKAIGDDGEESEFTSISTMKVI